MPDSSWPENKSYSHGSYDPAQNTPADTLANPQPTTSVSALDMEATGSDTSLDLQPRHGGRRAKSALVLAFVWGTIITLHWLSWGFWVILGLSSVVGIHLLRLFLARPNPSPPPLSGNPDNWPFVSLLVAAKNEEAVIPQLVKNICNLDYPLHRYELWVIDDNSSDQTPELLKQLASDYSQLKVFRRSPGAGGGKSGALNQAMSLIQGDIVAVFDADAQVEPSLLKSVVPLFQQPTIGAVQVRKSIANASTNLWTRGQEAEMALDTYLQQHRIGMGGVGGLRGNGQFVRRTALEQCGAWNEETITDDLDLTIRLHLARWDVEVLVFPAVLEEGVTTTQSLWHQRNRWAEGGYQRFLDYWPPIIRNQMGWSKSLDLLAFLIIEYLLPAAIVCDFCVALARNLGLITFGSRFLLTTPLSMLTITLSLVGIWVGLQQTQPEVSFSGFKRLNLALRSIHGTIYMLHWLIVVGSTTVRMAIRPKQLKWVKTVHQGSHKTQNPS